MKKKIVCLGGGIGNFNLIRGLKQYDYDITAIVSVADDGGSGGRIRRLYQMHPPGDIISCLAALSDEPKLTELLTYRLPGDRYADDHVLPGHKVGNLMLVAATHMSGSFVQGIAVLKDILHIQGNVFPATRDMVTISARTVEGQTIEGEENIDLGKYTGQRVLEKVFIHPADAAAEDKAVEAIKKADVIVTGPGDLYTSILPILIIPGIQAALLESNAQKIFVVNVANKPFETKGYSVEDFIQAIHKHVGGVPFQYIVVNDNYSIPIPKKYKYTYVKIDDHQAIPSVCKIITGDLVDTKFPLYHDQHKLAKLISETI